MSVEQIQALVSQEVHTDSDVFEAGTLTICAGSWTETMTASLGPDKPQNRSSAAYRGSGL